MTDTPRILIVEDDLATQALLSSYLGNAGYTVCTAASAASMREVLARDPVNLVLLDLNLPDADGVEVAHALRRQSRLPIVMVSARTQPRDRIAGLELGADDYITKPFHPRELVARVRNVLNRAEPSNETRNSVVYRFRGWEMDLLWRRLVDPDGTHVDVTATEFDLLAVLVSNAGQPLSRSQLLEATGAPGREVNDRSIDTLISRLRRKLGDMRGQTRMIETCHGRGYRFVPDVE